MSGSNDKSQKTEQPTPQRMRQAKKQGQVAKSKDITAFITTLSLTLFIWLMFSSAWDYVMVFATEALSSGDVDLDTVLTGRLHHALILLSTLTLPVIGVAFFTAVFSNIAQIGFVFSWHPVKPDISKLDPMSGLKRIFGFKNFVDFIRSFIKLSVLILSIFIVIKDSIHELFYIVECGISCIVNVWSVIAMKIIFLSILIFFFLSVFDFWFQRYQFNKDQMMTREEVKKDHKSSEGDPAIKGARKKIHREMSDEDVESIVKEAILILVSNTNIITLKYIYGETPLPILTLVKNKGQARDVLNKARKYDVAVHEDASLVKTILKKSKVNEYISEDTISDVAGLFSKLSLL